MLLKYKQFSEKLSYKLIQHGDVEGVMFLGGVARKMADEYSDIDISVFSNGKLTWFSPEDKILNNGYELDTFHVDMNKGFSDWDEVKKEAYSEGVIYYDRNGRVKEFLSAALNYSNEYWISRVILLIFRLEWNGWAYTLFRGKFVKNYVWCYTNDLWLRREKIENLFYNFRHSLDLLIELLYAVNKRWLPDYKWRYLKVDTLDWKPFDYHNKMRDLYFGGINMENWRFKSEMFQSLLDEIVEKVEGLLPDDWYYYISN